MGNIFFLNMLSRFEIFASKMTPKCFWNRQLIVSKIPSNYEIQSTVFKCQLSVFISQVEFTKKLFFVVKRGYSCQFNKFYRPYFCRYDWVNGLMSPVVSGPTSSRDLNAGMESISWRRVPKSWPSCPGSTSRPYWLWYMSGSVYNMPTCATFLW